MEGNEWHPLGISHGKAVSATVAREVTNWEAPHRSNPEGRVIFLSQQHTNYSLYSRERDKKKGELLKKLSL
jgi:hypothetical protein